MIQLRDVDVVVPAAAQGQPDRAILRDVTLDLAERRICVIGANGSGKSTFLRLLNGLRMPTRGRVVVAGHDTASQARKVRSQVAFIFSDPLAQLVMSTPVEDVELSLRPLVSGRAARREAAQALLRDRGIGHVAHQSIYDLSGGERQLVALTSVLAVNPSVLVADEPSTLLDLRNTVLIRRVLAGLPQQVIYSTHDLDFAGDADRVLVFDAGRVVADGPPAGAIASYVRMTGAAG